MTAVPLSTVLEGHPLAVVDVEGNGAQPPQIVEIAVLPVDGPAGPVTGHDLRTWLVRPAMPITPIAHRIHGIGNEDVERKPPWYGVAREVQPLLTGRTLVAHDASTEYRVLGAHLPGWQPPMVLDTLKLARHVRPGLPGYGLDALVVHTGLDTTGIGGRRPHRTGYDTWCAWQLLRALLDESGLDWDGLVHAAALTAFLPEREPGDGLW
ncbi:3'-5' exonuclease [Saccharothrix deserti]|uniref:3'-5' exonuclease n=1 Tax=Saccharothrix deserti TaxID=2593674 RepID=UPI00131A901B|nr:3'-5' exonuclease [Saccharothrix deserti]